jgi:glycosyltransferase involved in cell wall biosynthesis
VGVDVDVFHPLRREGKSNRFIVMYSGNLGLAYDFDTVLESARLLSRYRNIIIVIRGRGDLVPIVKTKIKELGLRNIFLHTERVERSELCKVLNSADVFLLPHRALNSAEKGLPTKLFEYQACGKPIICSSRGEPARYVKSTKSGIVVPPEDPEALSKAILELYRDEEKRRMLGMNGWIYVSTHLTTEKIGARISRVFHELLKT